MNAYAKNAGMDLQRETGNTKLQQLSLVMRTIHISMCIP